MQYPKIDITETWSLLNDDLIKLVGYVPDAKINWSPKPELWNFRGIMLHIAQARDGWMGSTGDGEDVPSVFLTTRTRPEIQREYGRTWERVRRFLADQAKLDATYHREHWDEDERRSGHWIAFHLLEHDIHHRADLLHYLALLGIETPEVGTP